MRRGRPWAWLTTAVAVCACVEPGPAEPLESMSITAFGYLDAALDVLEYNSVRRREIDWRVFRQRAFAEAVGAVSTADTHPVIAAAVERLGDGHSFFQAPVEPGTLRLGGPVRPPPAETTPSARLLGDVGYLDVPAFPGGGAGGDALASRYHALIEGVDTLGVRCGWVVDLRGNTGGNMWPMVAGVGPILGEGTVGYFVEPDSVTRSWVYAGGESRMDGTAIATASPAYALRSPDPRVAVLTDSLTASSGEALAVAFRGRADTRFFGATTWGVSTANAAFPLGDGAVIFLTVSTMADRTGRVYGSALRPDEPVAGGEKTGEPSTDPVLDAALRWLAGPVCD